jgi:hypothetical protein
MGRLPQAGLVACVALAMSGCGGQLPAPTGLLSGAAPTSAVGSASASVASRSPGVTGRDWAKAGLVEPGEGDPTRTTPPYVNPGSLGHPQAYQGGQADLLDISQGGPGLVAVGYLARDFRAAAWYSDDGLTWTRVSDFAADEFSVAAAVAAGERGLATVGAADTDASVWTSADGRTWQRLTLPAFHAETQIRMTAVTSWRGGFVAAGYTGSLVGPIRAAFWISADGRDWRRVADERAFADSRVAGLATTAEGAALVAVGAAGDAKTATGAVAWRSTDGDTWERAPDAATLRGAVMHSVAAGQGRLVAVGSDLAATRAVVWESADGLTWTQAPDDPTLDNFGLKIEMRDVSWTGSGYLAGGHRLFGTQYPSAVIWTSSDGRTWTRAADVPVLSQGKVQGVSAGGPGLVAVGSIGSPDFSIPTVWVSPPP